DKANDGTANRGSTQVVGKLLPIAGADDFDPEGNQEENPDRVALAVDGDPATSWGTLTYRGNPKLGGLKSGVGLIIDLGKVVGASSVEVTFVGTPTGA